MTSNQLPTVLMLIDGAVAADGGSILLDATDLTGTPIAFLLDRSIKYQREGTTQLYVDGVPILRGSPEEVTWLALLRDAIIPKAAADAVKQGTETAIVSLATRFVSLVSSADYQQSRAPAAPPLPQDRVRSLVMEGKTLDAIKAYREAHPDVGMTAASFAVKALAEEIEQGIQPDAGLAGAPGLAPPGRAPRE